jgi:molybdenum cofactor biosynthesis enzyme MoaA
VHCLSSSGRRDPRELTTGECRAVIDELERMQVFYVNIGGGEPTVRPDFWDLVDYATAHRVGVKFSTNGIKITPERAQSLAASDYVDVQISLDGATAEVNDAVRGPGSYAMAIKALENLHEAGFADAKISVVVTRQNATQLDEFKALAADNPVFAQLAAGNKIEAIKIVREATGLGLAEAKGVIERAERGADPRAKTVGLRDGKLPLEATVALQNGDKIRAIRIVRRAANLDLKDAKDAVDAAIAADPALATKFAAIGAARKRRALLWLAGFVAIAIGIALGTRF